MKLVFSFCATHIKHSLVYFTTNMSNFVRHFHYFPLEFRKNQYMYFKPS